MRSHADPYLQLFDATLTSGGPEPLPPEPDKAAVSGPPTPATPEAPEAAVSVLSGLDAPQRAAAEITGGPLLIAAGPGTGKTRTLAHRLAHLVTERGVDPTGLLTITFNRRAATELREQLTTLAPRHAGPLAVETFHSLGLEILRRHHRATGLSARFGIADPDTQLTIASRLAAGPRQARALLAEISRVRRESQASPLALEYMDALRAKDLVDFDDLVSLPKALMDADPEIARYWRHHFPWISVDEYQDIDAQQYGLLRHLCATDGNLTVIGDPDQAINRSQGGDVNFLLRFTTDFPHARHARLEHQYRCGSTILHAADQLIAPEKLMRAPQPQPVTATESTVGVHHAATETAEASFVARSIERLLGETSSHPLASGQAATQLGLSDFAVLYRTDGQARAIAEALTRAGLPFQQRSHERLINRPGVRELLDELAFADDTTGSLLSRLSGAAAALAARHRDDAQSVDVHTALELLHPLAESNGDDIDAFRSKLTLAVDVDSWEARVDQISLLTLHAAKGLEFPAVFIVGCEDGLLPLHNGDEISRTALAAERRLLYVGATRAQRHLYLSHTAARGSHGAMAPATRSPFLNELADGSFVRVGAAVPRNDEE